MFNFARNNRTRTVAVRVTDDEKAIIEGLMVPLNARTQSEVLRVALNYYLAHSPVGKIAVKKSVRE